MFTYYVAAKNEVEATLQAARKHNAGERPGVWLGHVTSKIAVWSVTFKAGRVVGICPMHVQTTINANQNVLI
jgi:hypothetical protein